MALVEEDLPGVSKGKDLAVQLRCDAASSY